MEQVDEEQNALAELPSTSVGQRASVRNMCYIIFTSGSTGRPKGAVLQHDSAVNFLHFINRRAHAGCWEVMRQAAVQRAEPGAWCVQAHALGGWRRAAKDVHELRPIHHGAPRLLP